MNGWDWEGMRSEKVLWGSMVEEEGDGYPCVLGCCGCCDAS